MNNLNIENFDEEYFISQANNIFIKLFSSLLLNNLDTIDHFISDEVYNIFNNEIKENEKNNLRHEYNNINIISTQIVEKYYDQNNYYLNLKLLVNYSDYYVDCTNYSYVSGDKVLKTIAYNLCFIKDKKIDSNEIARCSNCGNIIDINNNGKCSYCHSIFEQEKYGWILNKIEICK